MKILGDYIMLIVGLGIDMCFCHCAWHVLRQGEAIGFFFQVEDGIRDRDVTGVQTCALPISRIVRLPPSSTLRAEPKNFFGLMRAFASTPPDMIRPLPGCRLL